MQVELKCASVITHATWRDSQLYVFDIRLFKKSQSGFSWTDSPGLLCSVPALFCLSFLRWRQKSKAAAAAAVRTAQRIGSHTEFTGALWKITVSRSCWKSCILSAQPWKLTPLICANIGCVETNRVSVREGDRLADVRRGWRECQTVVAPDHPSWRQHWHGRDGGECPPTGYLAAGRPQWPEVQDGVVRTSREKLTRQVRAFDLTNRRGVSAREQESDSKWQTGADGSRKRTFFFFFLNQSLGWCVYMCGSTFCFCFFKLFHSVLVELIQLFNTHFTTEQHLKRKYFHSTL